MHNRRRNGEGRRGIEVRVRLVLTAFALGICGSGFGQSIFTIAGGGSDDGRPATIASLFNPVGVAADGQGNFYIADVYDNQIRKVGAKNGLISTVAGKGPFAFSGDGGPATLAGLAAPYGVAVDAAGNLYIADTNSHRIRKVTAATGVITTIAGNGAFGYSGDTGPAISAAFDAPTDVVVDGAGNVIVADTNNNRVRKVNAGTGIITTVAGNGTRAYGGDNGPATAAALSHPYGVAVD